MAPNWIKLFKEKIVEKDLGTKVSIDGEKGYTRVNKQNNKRVVKPKVRQKNLSKDQKERGTRKFILQPENVRF